MTAISSVSTASFAATTSSSPTLKQGSSGSAVTQLQNLLKSKGYNISADGQFGPKTKAAVLAFQRAKGLTADGIVGPKTWSALRAAPAQTSSGSVLKQGSTGAGVTEMQNLLRNKGFNVSADGQFGPATTNAVVQFQRINGLTADGIVGAQTWAKLRGSAVTNPGTPLLRQGASGNAVKALQNMLRISADGQFGPATKNAVIGFQRAHGLAADGIVGPATWAKLNGASSSGTVSSGGVTGKQALANAARSVALSMGGYSSQGLCATGVSRAIRQVYGITVYGNGNQIDNNLPRDKFKQVNISLEEALKIPGLVITWEKTSTRLGSIYGHTAITLGDGHSSASDFIEGNTLAVNGSRSGMKIFMPIA